MADGHDDPPQATVVAPVIEVVKKSNGTAKKLGSAVDFPSRRDAEPDTFVGECVLLRPFVCDALGPRGRQPKKLGEKARGLWFGRIEPDDPNASFAATPGSAAESSAAVGAAAAVAPVLVGTVVLDCCGVLASARLDPQALRFLRSSDEDDDREAAAVTEALGGPPAGVFRLAGLYGQILSHAARLWVRPLADGAAAALLRLQPRKAPEAKGVFHVDRASPLGPVTEAWEEVAMIELPHLLRIMIGAESGGDALAHPGSDSRAGFLVDEEEEQVVIHAWRRSQGDNGNLDNETAVPPSETALGCIEQLVWYDTIASLAETRPCAEVRVPATRLKLEDEGLGTREELLGEGIDSREAGVPDEDRARLGSLAFLRQYVSEQALQLDVLPRLFADEACGGRGHVRVLSATLDKVPEAVSGNPSKQPTVRPKTIDDLFSDDVDFRVSAPWTVTESNPDEDPLKLHELTSVILFSEKMGFLLTFHCLQGVDPLTAN